MTQSFFDQNRFTFQKFARLAHLFGWGLLVTAGIHFILQIYVCAAEKFSWDMYARVILSGIKPIFFSAVILLISQFLRSLLNPRYQANWLFLNAPWVFRLYAAVLIGGFLYSVIYTFHHFMGEHPRYPYYYMFTTEIPHLIKLTAEIMLLYALAHLSQLVITYLHKQRITMNSSIPQAL